MSSAPGRDRANPDLGGNRPDVAIPPSRASPRAARCSLAAAAAATTTTAPSRDGRATSASADPGDCIVVDMAVSSEKIALLTELADEFNDSDGAEVDGRCVFVRPAQRGVGQRRQPDRRRAGPNPEVNGEPPVIWSPAASGWAGDRQRARPAQMLAPAGTPFMLTPLVIAMPRADGRGARLAGRADRLRRPRRRSPTTPRAGRRSATRSGARSGSARPTPTTPRAGSTSRSPSTTRPTGKTAGLTVEDLARPGGRRVRHRRSSRRSCTTATSR